jgi:hypothetical protein
MHRVAPLVCLLALAACGGPHTGDDDGGTPDGNVAMSALVFQFEAPDLGTQVGDVTVDQIVLNLHNARATGDTDTSSVDRAQVSLDGSTVPEVRFDEVQSGRYGLFEFGIERAQDGAASWTMEGTVASDSNRDFLLEDEQGLSISLPLGALDLEPGKTATITVDVDVGSLCSDVDWTMVDTHDGDYEIDNDSSQMDGIRTNLRLAFSIGGTQIE